MQIEDLNKEQFPFIHAFKVLNDSTSNSAQSAPVCVLDWPEDRWQHIEDQLSMISAFLFVNMALPREVTQDTTDRVLETSYPALNEFNKGWE